MNKPQLEFNHIAPYLPFGLKFLPIYYNENKKLDKLFYLSDLRDHKSYFGVNGYTSNNIKPVLRPLSDLTNEIEVNGERFVPKDVLKKMWAQIFENSGDGIFLLRFEDFITFGNLNKMPFWFIQKLIEWHFDVFGLIEKGLAVDYNTVFTQK